MWQTGPRELNATMFSRRAFILLIGKSLMVGAILIRLLILQIFKAKEYKTLSDHNRIKFILIYPQRGVIRDINGRELACNKETYKIYFYKQKRKPHEKILKPVFDILGHSSKDRVALLKLAKKAAYLQPIIIKKNAHWKNIARIEAETHRLPGMFVEKSFMRHYPLRAKLAHVMGYIGLPNKKEVTTYKLQYAREARIGKTGVEGYLNHSLIGKFGAKRVEVNASRVVVRDLSVKPSFSGNNVNLTINIDFQNFLYDLFPKSRSAAATVIEIPTGNVLAMCSLPSFDPNLFTTEFDKVKWQNLLRTQYSPFINKVIGKAYPPGSTWKIITSLAILESGISPNEKVFCNGSIRVGNRIFKCWKRSGHGYVNTHRAITASCNCYFYKMGIDVGIANIYKIARTLGFGQKIGIELSGESQGINPNKQWKTNVFSEKWTHGDTANAAIGQGFVLATPLQLLMMISRIASGKMIYPSLLKNHGKNFSATDLPFKKENLEILKKGLIGVINNPRGTSFTARIRPKPFWMAGKTGTAQVVSRDTAAAGTKVNRNLRSHSIFVGYAPVYSPRYATIVVADNAGWGSATAAPIGRDILLFAQKNTPYV